MLFVRPKVAELTFQLYGRSLHPELFEIFSSRKVERGGYSAKIDVTSAGHVPAESRMTLVRVARSEPCVSLIKLEPRTGRSHQLRVQCAKRHLPIVGDQTYGDFAAYRAFAKLTGTKRLCLHSSETSFEYEFGGKRCVFEAKAVLPEEFGVGEKKL